MDTASLVKQLETTLKSKKTQNYSYVIIFLLIFSIFIVAAIKPALTTAFSLQREEAELTKLDAKYDEAIISIVNTQSLIEEVRDDLPLYDAALPDRPNVNTLLNDIQTAAAENEITPTSINVGEVNLKQVGGIKVKTLKITMEASSSFDKLRGFTDSLITQRRLKAIDQFKIEKNDKIKGSTESGELKLSLEVEGLYL